jgi:hypothetical protein
MIGGVSSQTIDILDNQPSRPVGMGRALAVDETASLP